MCLLWRIRHIKRHQALHTVLAYDACLLSSRDRYDDRLDVILVYCYLLTYVLAKWNEPFSFRRKATEQAAMRVKQAQFGPLDDDLFLIQQIKTGEFSRICQSRVALCQPSIAASCVHFEVRLLELMSTRLWKSDVMLQWQTRALFGRPTNPSYSGTTQLQTYAFNTGRRRVLKNIIDFSGSTMENIV